MHEIELPPVDVSGHAGHGDRDTIISLIVEKSERRVGERLGYVLAAIDDFKDSAPKHIEDHLHFAKTDVTFTFAAVVAAFTEAAAEALFPEAKYARIVFEGVVKLITENLEKSIDDSVEANAEAVADAKVRLELMVAALAAETRRRETLALEHAKALVQQAVEEGMQEIPEVSSYPEWIEATCDWLGFPEPNHQAISDPVRQWLEYAFVGLLAQVQAEMEQEHAVPGIDPDEIHPDIWAHEARDEEQRLYREEGEKAWDDAYKMSDE